MDDETFNMSMRKVLKQVGVTSQQAIEKLVRGGGIGQGKLKMKMVLAAEGTSLRHEAGSESNLG